MKSEQLFEIDRKINQIKRGIEQRQERVTEWEVPVHRILQEKKNKDYYLSKKYPHQHVRDQQKENTHKESYGQQLKDHVEQSRVRIKFFKNDLKELQELVKKRNVIRLIKIGQRNTVKKMDQNDLQESQSNSMKKEYSKTNYQGMFFRDIISKKIERQHNAFSGIKGEKILEIYQENKVKMGNSEEAMGNLKKQLGIGLQNTPFYTWFWDKTNDDKSLLKNKSKFSQRMSQTNIHYNLYQSLKKEVTAKKGIYLSRKNQEGEKFQKRLKNIIRYHHRNIENLTL